MAVFQVHRVNDGWLRKSDPLLDKKLLADGPHFLEHQGVSVPIFVRGHEVTVDVEGARGDLARVWPSNGSDLEEMRRDGRSTYSDTIPLGGPYDAVQITGIRDEEDNEVYAGVERHHRDWQGRRR